jgi:hypothetical protein
MAPGIEINPGTGMAKVQTRPFPGASLPDASGCSGFLGVVSTESVLLLIRATPSQKRVGSGSLFSARNFPIWFGWSCFGYASSAAVTLMHPAVLFWTLKSRS